MFSLPYFEHQLVMYVTSDDKSTFESAFDISKIPVVTREQADAEDRTKKLTASMPTLKAPKVTAQKPAAGGAEAAASATAAAQQYAQELMAIPEMKEFGSVLKSSPAVELTESETEYVVKVIKHIFKEHIVLQYDITNTLDTQVIDNVSVLATPADEEEFEEVFIMEAERLVQNEPGKVYVAFKKTGGEGAMPVASITSTLKFISKEIDPSTNQPEDSGFDDEYEVSEFDLAGSDYVIPTYASNFAHLWEQIGASGEEAEETLQLSSMKSIAGMSSTTLSRRSLNIGSITDLDQLQRRPNNSPRSSPCSPSRAPTCPSTRRRTRSSSWARRSTAGGWSPTCAWPTRPSRASRPRSRCAPRRTTSPRWWLPPWRRRACRGDCS